MPSNNNQKEFQRFVNKEKRVNQPTSRPITTQDVRNYANRRKAKLGLVERKSALEKAISRSEAPARKPVGFPVGEGRSSKLEKALDRKNAPTKKPVGFPVRRISSGKGAPSIHDNIINRARGEKLNALHGGGNNYTNPKTTPFLQAPAKEQVGPTIEKAIAESKGIRKWMLEHPTAARRLKTAGKAGAVTGALGVGSFGVYKAKKAIQNRAEAKKRG